MRIPPLLLAAFLVACLTGALFLLSYPVAYYQYGRLIEIGPENRAQVEGGLVLYTAREIDMTDSAWGHGTELEAGEYCRQYLILGREPIDVVYDEEDRVVHIFPSFE